MLDYQLRSLLPFFHRSNSLWGKLRPGEPVIYPIVTEVVTQIRASTPDPDFS